MRKGTVRMEGLSERPVIKPSRTVSAHVVAHEDS